MLGFDLMEGPPNWKRTHITFYFGDGGYRSCLFFGFFDRNWALFFPGWCRMWRDR
jgi:hypothetical protein